jgi:hypothetical protein
VTTDKLPGAFWVQALSVRLFGVHTWQHRESAWSWLAVGVALLATAGYALWLLPSSGTGLPPWLRPALIGLALAAVATLIVPAVASASVVSSGLGPFETPFETQQATNDATLFFGAPFSVAGMLPALESGNRGAPYLMATLKSLR